MMKLDIQLFAVPFRKTSKTRKRMRRTHYKISENEDVLGVHLMLMYGKEASNRKQ